MQADSAGAKTWLLGALALWALCVWVLALFGLGGRVSRLPEDPALVQRLPQQTRPLPERLGPLAEYSEIGARPLFAEDRRPQPFFIDPDGQGPDTNAFDFILTSVLLTPAFKMAIVQPTAGGESIRLKIGDAPQAAPGWHLGSIDPRSVVFNGPEGERKLELRVYDGTGGQMPTGLNAIGQPTIPTPATLVATPPNTPRQATQAQPQPQPTPVPTSPPAGNSSPAEASDAGSTNTDADQIEAIRRRIEERRARLRQEAQPPSPEAQKP